MSYTKVWKAHKVIKLLLLTFTLAHFSSVTLSKTIIDLKTNIAELEKLFPFAN